MSKSIRALAFLICLFSFSALIYYQLSGSPLQRNAGFRLVRKMSGCRIAAIVNDYPSELVCHFSPSSEPYTISRSLKFRKLGPNGYNNALITASPSGRMVFVGYNGNILKLEVRTDDFRLAKALRLGRKLGSENYSPNVSFMVASKRCLWFSGFDAEQSVYEWNYAMEDENFIKTNYVHERYNLGLERYKDKISTDLIAFTPQPIPVPCISSNPTVMAGYDVIDYQKGSGWVFSSHFLAKKNETSGIVYYSGSVGEKTGGKFIAEGACAVWGADNYVYYLKGKGDFWRSDTATGIAELVYKTEAGSIDIDVSLSPAVLSHDRRFLAYAYRNRIVLFDLTRKEYRIIRTVLDIRSIALVVD